MYWYASDLYLKDCMVFLTPIHICTVLDLQRNLI